MAQKNNRFPRLPPLKAIYVSAKLDFEEVFGSTLSLK
jgi:hypothetical protein